MLTKLSVKGFKSLEDVTVHFGPFTCIAGANGAGKSNLFDAILFLSDLTRMSIMDAARRVRDRSEKPSGPIASIFTRTKNSMVDVMEFAAEFVVPGAVVDDFDQHAEPRVTLLRYELTLQYVPADENESERIVLRKESLRFIPKSDFRRTVFPMSDAFWDSIKGGTKTSPFISTAEDSVFVHQDESQSRGRPERFSALGARRTVLSTISSVDRPTAFAARREMESWVLLQLEPSALRKEDEFSTPSDVRVSPTGAHMPATLKRLNAGDQIANRLSELLPDVARLSVDVDERRQTKTLVMTNKDGISFPAKALSDGTLRFLALAIMHSDGDAGGVICLEEPENGIHPSRVNAMTRLLRDMAVDTSEAVSDDNPLRQVIINTHSPLVVQSLRTADLVVCGSYRKDGATYTDFSFIAETWRAQLSPDHHPTSLGTLVAYLNKPDEELLENGETVREHLQTQLTLPLPEIAR
ncbi:AAA family ATPase [Ralstonia pseudosolanacearum]|uniref:AAA family ATPase n=1 Tax=Ralstonia pseudosolanacearum TaxID=1310165 RepID=UPI001C765C2B|nr:ATP-binding protein [Ralstonia sp. RS642]QWQ12635.1 AAA family ATPase [Ralstonia solanacearum]UZF25779.1 AAA family ATPase [Ralstonia sp. RS642]